MFICKSIHVKSNPLTQHNYTLYVYNTISQNKKKRAS